MIIRKKEHWFKMLFIWHGSVLPGLLPRLLLLFLLSLAVVYAHGTIFSFKVPLNPSPLTLSGFVLALFLGFRNSASYDRYWEARKLWGILLNTNRSLVRQFLTLPSGPADTRRTSSFVGLLNAFTFALKHQLRGTDPAVDLEERLDKEQLAEVSSAKYKPIILLNLLARSVARERAEGKIDPIQQACFEEHFNQLSGIVGGCERIVTTPIPYSYRVLLHRTVYIYCFLLPFGLVDSLGWLTPFIVVFIAYTFVAFEAIADEIEEPFGTDANDLALNQMCRMIEYTTLESAGLPVKAVPVAATDVID